MNDTERERVRCVISLLFHICHSKPFLFVDIHFLVPVFVSPNLAFEADIQTRYVFNPCVASSWVLRGELRKQHWFPFEHFFDLESLKVSEMAGEIEVEPTGF